MAYVRLVAGVLGAVTLTTLFWAGWFHHALKIRLLRQAIPTGDILGELSALWGVELTGNLAVDSVAFAISRLISPFVLGTLIVGAVLALSLAR